MAEVHDAAYWRGRAEEVREMAKGMKDPDTKRKMLNVAATYDRMAEHMEKGLPPPSRKNPNAEGS